jgi:hypothetical protein
MIAPAIAYGLSFFTALACAVLLSRAYRSSRAPLIFWSALCFWGLSLTNALVFVDLVLVPERDLYPLRLGAGLSSIAVLLFGMVWESR